MNEDLCKFLQNMQMKLSNDISAGNEALKNEINEGRREMREMKNEIQAINKTIENVKGDTKEVMKDVKKVKKDTTTVIDDVNKLKNRMDKIEGKIEDIEKNEKSDSQKRKREENMEGGARMDNGQVSTYSEKLKAGNTDRVLQSKVSWADEVEEVSLENQLKMATEAAEAARLEGQKYTRQMKNTKKPIKLGDSTELHDQEDWGWEQSTTDWDGTTDRVVKNAEKKAKDRLKKKAKLEKAVLVGKCTLGIGPIKYKSYEYFNTITADFEESKKMAAAEFLTGYLKYDHDDMTDMSITDMKISAKNDDILYIVLDSPSKVRNIRRRIADCQNPNIKTREFIPPAFYERYTALARFAKELREKDDTIKTQIRFEQVDIGLYTKTRGTDGQFEPMRMEEIEMNGRLPPIDLTVQWKKKVERPAWRQISPQKQKVYLKSLGQVSPTTEPEVKRKKNDESPAKENMNISDV